MQAFSDVHDTPLSVLEPVLNTGLGVRLIVHALPLHLCARVSCAPALVPKCPTAVQKDADLHQTSLNAVVEARGAFGIRKICQTPPLQRSASGALAPARLL